MKKDELIRFVSENANVAIRTAGDTINAVIEVITSALEKGDFISLISHRGFATELRDIELFETRCSIFCFELSALNFELFRFIRVRKLRGTAFNPQAAGSSPARRAIKIKGLNGLCHNP